MVHRVCMWLNCVQLFHRYVVCGKTDMDKEMATFLLCFTHQTHIIHRLSVVSLILTLFTLVLLRVTNREEIN